MTPRYMFAGPSGLDLLAEFRKKFVTLAERRTVELRTILDEHRNDAPSSEMSAVFEEYDSLRYFEQELHRLICVFVEETRTPLLELICRIDPWARSSLEQVGRMADAAGEKRK
jgi:hypothetical protein